MFGKRVDRSWIHRHEFHAVIGRLIRSGEAAEEVLSQAFDTLDALKERGAASLTYGDRLNILFSALSMVRPREAGPLKITRFNEAWVKLTGEKLFVEATADMASDYRRFANVFSELFGIMQDDWQWEPQDWLDIQGFLWIVLDNTATAPLETETVRKPGGRSHQFDHSSSLSFRPTLQISGRIRRRGVEGRNIDHASDRGWRTRQFLVAVSQGELFHLVIGSHPAAIVQAPALDPVPGFPLAQQRLQRRHFGTAPQGAAVILVVTLAGGADMLGLPNSAGMVLCPLKYPHGTRPDGKSDLSGL